MIMRSSSSAEYEPHPGGFSPLRQIPRKRAEVEQAIKAKADEKALHDAVDRFVSRLVPLVRHADELRNNAEAVPTQYAPKAAELKKEVEAAKAIIANAPSTDDGHVKQLQQAVASAESLIPDLEKRARLWDEFVVARNEIDALIERLQQPLDAVRAKSKRSTEEAGQDVDTLRNAAQQLTELETKIVELQRISELLYPLESAYADVRFFDIDAEQTRHQYGDVLNVVAAELEEETLLKQSADQVAKEINDIRKMLDSTDLERSILATISMTDIPALKAQINRIKDRIVNADASREHVVTNSKIAENLDKKLAKLKTELEDAIKTSDEHAKEQLAVSPSSLISHHDLVAGLPEKVFQVQHAIDDKNADVLKEKFSDDVRAPQKKTDDESPRAPVDRKVSPDESISKSLEDARLGVHDVAYKKDFDLRKCFSMCFREDGRLAEQKSNSTRARWNGRSSEGGPLQELASLRVAAQMRAIFEHPSLEKAESVTSDSESDNDTESVCETLLGETSSEDVDDSSDSEDVRTEARRAGSVTSEGSLEEEEETPIVATSSEDVDDSSDSEDVRITTQMKTESVTSEGNSEEEEEEETPIVATSSDDVEDHCADGIHPPEFEDVAISKTEFQRNLDTQNEEYEKRLSIARAHRMWWEEETARLEPNGRKTRRDKVQKVLADNVTVIFVIGERSCRLQNSDGKVVRVDGNVDVRLGVMELTGQQTFPQLFINGKLSQA